MAEQSTNGASHMIVIDRQSCDLAIPASVGLGLRAQAAETPLCVEQRVVFSNRESVPNPETLRPVVSLDLLRVGSVPFSGALAELIAIGLPVTASGLDPLRLVPPALHLRTALRVFGLPLQRGGDLLLAMGSVVGLSIGASSLRVSMWHRRRIPNLTGFQHYRR